MRRAVILYYKDNIPTSFIPFTAEDKFIHIEEYNKYIEDIKRYKVEDYLKKGYLLAHLYENNKLVISGYLGYYSIEMLNILKEMAEFKIALKDQNKYNKLDKDIINFYLYIDPKSRIGRYYFLVIYGKFMELLNSIGDEGINKRFLVVEHEGDPYLVYENITKKIYRKMYLYLFNPDIISRAFENLIC